MSEYITLQDATKFCSYTQEYLSLRARRGKLKAVKLGRNWFSTRDWLEEYITKSESYKRQKESRQVFVEPPRNLPIHAPDAEIWEDGIPEDVARQKEFQRKFQFAIATALVTTLFAVSTFLGHQKIFRVAENASPVILSSAVSLQEIIKKKGFALGNEVELYFGTEPGKIATDYVVWLGAQARNMAEILTP